MQMHVFEIDNFIMYSLRFLFLNNGLKIYILDYSKCHLLEIEKVEQYILYIPLIDSQIIYEYLHSNDFRKFLL